MFQRSLFVINNVDTPIDEPPGGSRIFGDSNSEESLPALFS